MEIKDGLGQWMAEKRDEHIFDQLGNTPTKVFLVNNRAGTSTIVATDLMTLADFAKAKTYASSIADPLIPPVKISKVGQKTIYRYVGLMHDNVAYDIQINDPVYGQTAREAGARGDGNQMFSGALIDFQGMMLYQHPGCPLFTNWGSGANINGAESYLLGRQAVIVGIGGYRMQKKNGYLKMVEKKFDLNCAAADDYEVRAAA